MVQHRVFSILWPGSCGHGIGGITWLSRPPYSISTAQMHIGQQNLQKFSIQYAESMYSNSYSTLLVYLHISVSCKHTYDTMLTLSTVPTQGGPQCYSWVSPVGVYICISARLELHHCSVRMCQCIVYCAVGGAWSRVPLIDLHTAGMADYPGLPHTHTNPS